MSDEALAKIWTTLGLASLYVSFNAFLRVQGSEIYLPGIDFSDAGRYPTAVYGLGATVFPYFLLLYVTRIYVSTHGGGRWEPSLPVAFNLAIDPEARHGRAYQRWFALFFLVCPAVCRLLLLRKMFGGSVFRRDDKELVASGFVEHLFNYFSPTVILTNDFVIGSVTEDKIYGVTYFPFWQSWFFLLMEAGLLVLLIWVAAMIIRVHCRYCARSKGDISG